MSLATGPASQRLKDIIERSRLHPPVYSGSGKQDWRCRILEQLKPTDTVLDVGKSSRDFHPLLKAAAAKVETLDLNRFEDYPDHLVDLCQPPPASMLEAFDVVVCFSVLEALHDPQAGIDSLKAMLKPGGRLYLFAPFIGKYEAPPGGAWHDFYRFTRDGLAFLLRDFSSVDIFPVRGQYSAIANLLPHWKLWVEQRLGHRLNRLLDCVADPKLSALNSSGYYVLAVK